MNMIIVNHRNFIKSQQSAIIFTYIKHLYSMILTNFFMNVRIKIRRFFSINL
jgi:hypothetical protein